MFFKSKFVKQTEHYDCGLACIATIASYYKYKLPLSYLKKISNIDLKKGISLHEIIRVSKHIGFKAIAVRSKKSIKNLQGTSFPAIAQVNLENGEQHFIVIHSLHKKKVEVVDPLYGKKNYAYNDFDVIWTRNLLFLTPTDEVMDYSEKSKLTISIIHNIKKNYKKLVAILLFSALISMLGIYISLYSKIVIDDLTNKVTAFNLTSVSLFFVSLIIAKEMTDFIRSQVLLNFSKSINQEIVDSFFTHLIHLPTSFFSKYKNGEVISRFNDLDSIIEIISSVSISLIIDFIMILIGATILYIESSTMFYASLVPLILYIILMEYYSKKIKEKSLSMMKKGATLTAYLIESIKGIESIKSLNCEDYVNDTLNLKTTNLLQSIFEYGKTNNSLNFLKKLIRNLFTILIFWLGIILLKKNLVSLGTVVAFNSLLIYFIDPVERIVNLQPQLQKASLAFQRLNEIMNVDIEINNLQTTVLSSYDIKFENVFFSYTIDEIILKNLSFEIKEGEKIALVGKTGSGKSTIAKLLVKFYQLNSGNIYLGGINLNDINTSYSRRIVEYIPQNLFFFSGTIFDNLTITNSKSTIDDVNEVCKIMQIDTFIKSTPLGYYTVLDENGDNLSLGQKQRLALARALLSKPRVIIMDESTSNLDYITDAKIMKIFNTSLKNVTIIFITHKLESIINCNRIFMLKEGYIVESGGHEELLEKKGEYYNFCTNS